MFCKKGALKNLANLTVKHLCQSLFFHRLAGLTRFPQAQVFSWEICKYFKNTFFYRTPKECVFGIRWMMHWRLSTILGTSRESVWSNVFWYVKVCILWKCIQYTIHWDRTEILKKFPSDKINGTKNALFFLWSSNLWQF